MRTPILVGERDVVDVVRPVHPVASVYTRPSRDVPWGTRLSDLVDRLHENGADEATIDDAVSALRYEPATAVAVFADGGNVPAMYATPGRTGQDLVRVGAAHVLPLLEWSQDMPSCVLVVEERATVWVTVSPGRLVATVVEPVRCAAETAVAACGVALGRSCARLVAVRGSDRLVERLRDAFGPDVTVRPVRTPTAARLTGLARTTAALWTAGKLADLAERSNLPGHTVQGVDETLDALARGTVQDLLVTTGSSAGPSAWFGTNARQVRPFDDSVPPAWVRRRGAAADVAVRAALLSGASVRVLRPGLPGSPEGGLGGLCRFPLSVVRS
ncbi:hypothetical protein [Actinokineospora globicatena]|uniref:Uncharacterized protein n=1 Tax=Actinokineospora globicatena TaxID=103729 RepID=A0A9W6V8K1_9PSEU|nr:hypothetical protein [Actinokineospora globicatena]GLW90051.1 hypothetical protein Aglo03_08670 [Actinokineospora globicatena]